MCAPFFRKGCAGNENVLLPPRYCLCNQGIKDGKNEMAMASSFNWDKDFFCSCCWSLIDDTVVKKWATLPPTQTGPTMKYCKVSVVLFYVRTRFPVMQLKVLINYLWYKDRNILVVEHRDFGRKTKEMASRTWYTEKWCGRNGTSACNESYMCAAHRWEGGSPTQNIWEAGFKGGYWTAKSVFVLRCQAALWLILDVYVGYDNFTTWL